MNGRIKTTNLDKLDALIKSEDVPQNANIHVRLPLCIGWAKPITRDNLEQLVAALREKTQKFTFYMNFNTENPEAVKSWLNQNADVLNLLNEGEVEALSKWRESGAWVVAKNNYGIYYSAYSKTARLSGGSVSIPETVNPRHNDTVDLDELFRRDALTFYGRKYKNPASSKKDKRGSASAAKSQTIEQQVPPESEVKKSEAYILNEVIDCLSWMETKHVSNGFISILLYHNRALYQAMTDAYDKNPDSIGYRHGSLLFAPYDFNITNESKNSPPSTPLDPYAESVIVSATNKVAESKGTGEGAKFLVDVLAGLQRHGLFSKPSPPLPSSSLSKGFSSNAAMLLAAFEEELKKGINLAPVDNVVSLVAGSAGDSVSDKPMALFSHQNKVINVELVTPKPEAPEQSAVLGLN